MGATIREQFSDAFQRDTFDKITGTSTAVVQLPSVPGRMFRLKADSNNAASIFIGSMQNTGSAAMPFEMEAGYDTGWNPLEGNLDRYMYNGASGSYLMFWVMG